MINSFEIFSKGLGFNPDFKNHTKTPFQKDCAGNNTLNCQHMNSQDLDRVRSNAIKRTIWTCFSAVLFMTQVFQLFSFVARTRALNGIQGSSRNDFVKCLLLFPLVLVQLASEWEIYSI